MKLAGISLRRCLRAGMGLLALLAVPVLSGRAEATAPNALVVVRHDAGAASGPIAAAAGAHWQVRQQDAAHGLLLLEPADAQAAPTGTLVGMMMGQAGVRAAEPLVPVDLGGDLHGSAIGRVEFDDDLDMAAVRPSGAYQAMGTPLAPAPAGSYTPRVAVLDGGFVAGHVALPSGTLAAQFDALDGGTSAMDPGNGIDDDQDGVTDAGVGHGLAMAAAIHVLCPSAKVLPVRVLDDEGRGDSYALARGLAWALAQDVDVIQLGLCAHDWSPVVESLLAEADAAGVLVVAPTGNHGSEALAYPAASPHVLAVSGVAPDGSADAATNYASGVYLSAPSRAVPGPHPSGSQAFAWWSGSSIASALVAGTLALRTSVAPGHAAACRDDVADEAQGFGALPPARVGKQGAGVPDVESAAAP